MECEGCSPSLRTLVSIITGYETFKDHFRYDRLFPAMGLQFPGTTKNRG